MNWNKGVRQTHRWMSIAFTLTVIAAFVAVAQEKPACVVAALRGVFFGLVHALSEKVRAFIRDGTICKNVPNLSDDDPGQNV